MMARRTRKKSFLELEAPPPDLRDLPRFCHPRESSQNRRLSPPDLAIDLKLCSCDGREKEIIVELNDDILGYKAQFGNVLFIVYDLGLNRDVELFTSAFEVHANVLVRVVKH
jgi:hypothetical protein